jgi:hemerythrin-like metal-binding protein
MLSRQRCKMEHQAIENALQTLGDAMVAGARSEILTEIMDTILDSSVAHFRNEEQEFRNQCYAGSDGHARAHETLLGRLRSVRTAVSEGQPEAILAACDLLNSFHDHIDRLDRPAFTQILRQHSANGSASFHQLAELDRIMQASHAAVGREGEEACAASALPGTMPVRAGSSTAALDLAPHGLND